MFLWIDFFAMPQPLSARFKGMSKAAAEAAMAAEKRARHAGMVAAKDGQAQGHSGMDHRQVDDKEEEVARLVALLTTAVDCIPGYIQRCAMMWVLVPPIHHADVDLAVCDYASWCARAPQNPVASRHRAGRASRLWRAHLCSARGTRRCARAARRSASPRWLSLALLLC